MPVKSDFTGNAIFLALPDQVISFESIHECDYFSLLM